MGIPILRKRFYGNSLWSSAATSITDIAVVVAIDHTWAGDLRINLEAPTGESIDLVTILDLLAVIAVVIAVTSSCWPIIFVDGSANNAESMGSTILVEM